jgi:hypothetical protein
MSCFSVCNIWIHMMIYEVCVFFGNLSSRMTTHGERLWTGASKGDGSHRTPTIPGDKTDHCWK